MGHSLIPQARTDISSQNDHVPGESKAIETPMNWLDFHTKKSMSFSSSPKLGNRRRLAGIAMFLFHMSVISKETWKDVCVTVLSWLSSCANSFPTLTWRFCLLDSGWMRSNKNKAKVATVQPRALKQGLQSAKLTLCQHEYFSFKVGFQSVGIRVWARSFSSISNFPITARDFPKQAERDPFELGGIVFFASDMMLRALKMSWNTEETLVKSWHPFP